MNEDDIYRMGPRVRAAIAMTKDAKGTLDVLEADGLDRDALAAGFLVGVNATVDRLRTERQRKRKITVEKNVVETDGG